MPKRHQASQLALGDIARGRNNNLDSLRLCAAILVVISHSFALLYGSDNFSGEPLSVLTNGSLSIGGFAVGVFFLFGGYLISKSCESSGNAKTFLSKRCLRIFPELILVVLSITFVFGPLFSSFDPMAYYSSSETYLYLRNLVLIPTHPLPGVFASNPYPLVVNGSLWTLPVEFVCYLLVYAAYRLTKFNKKKYALLCIPPLLATIFYFLYFSPMQLSVVRAVLLFWIGTTLYVYRDLIPYNRKACLISIPLFFLLVYLGAPTIAMLVAFPPMMFFLAYDVHLGKGKRNNMDDVELSYGIFLWGWPVGQGLVQTLPNVQLAPLIVTTILLSALLAFFTNMAASHIVSALKTGLSSITRRKAM